jgi:class 3 adenylate cyclase
MDTTRNISSTELLLQIMELTSRGASTRAQVSKQLRRAHPLARLDRRLSNALDVLIAEGLLESTDESGEKLFQTATDGLVTLEQNGRYSDTATVLFTDIVGSTELIDGVGEAGAHEMRQRHFAILRASIERSGGREVKNLGDGLMVIFADANAALGCAGDMQRKVSAGDDALGLRVGVHAGELLRDGNDFFGSTVIIARRLCDLAESGQTIASLETRASSDEQFESLGALALKGLTASVESVSLVWSKPTASLTS